MLSDRRTALLGRASLVALTLGALAAPAMAAEIRGRVVDAGSGAPLPGATVRIEGSAVEVDADSGGQFVLRDLPAGAQTVIVDYVGYPQRRESLTAADKAPQSEIRMSSGEGLQTLVVTGARLADRRALQIEKAADNKIEALVADDVGKLPDQNVAEAVRRLPGLSVANDQGEGRYVVIRGVNPNLANVTLNGQTAAAPEPDGRQVKLDDIPSAMIGSVTVTKSLTADLDANAIAGQVDISTLSAFDRNKAMFADGRAAYGRYNMNGQNPYEMDGQVGGLFGPERQFGLVVSGNYSRRPIESENLQGSTNFRPVNGFVVPDQFGLRDYNLVRARTGFVANFDWRPNDRTRLFLRTSYSKFTDHESRDQNRIDNESAFTGQTATTGTFKGRGSVLIRKRDEDDNTQTLSGGGRFELGAGRLEVEAAWTRAEKDDPLRSEYNFRTGSSALTVNYDTSSSLYVFTPDAVASDPTKYSLNSVNYDRRKAVERIDQIRADYTLPFSGIGSGSELKFGAKYLDRHKVNDRGYFTYGLASGQAFPLAGVSYVGDRDFYEGRYSFGPRIDYAAAQAYVAAHPNVLALNRTSSLNNSLAVDYDVSEKITAGYVMATFRLDKLTLIPGVRVEHTSDDTAAKTVTAASTFDEPFNSFGHKDYTNVFPGLNARYDVSRELVLRGAVTTAIGRPNYPDLAPYVSIDATASPVAVSLGNTNLKPLKAVNLEASVEYYLPLQGVLSASVFYKSIDDPIYTQTLQVSNGTYAGQTFASAQVTQPLNVDHEHVEGVEFNAQAQFTFLPGIFSGLGASANLTLVDGNASGVAGRTGDLPLFFQSKRVASVQLFYEKYGVSARVAYSFRSKYLDTLGADPTTDQYTDDNGQLDVRASYALTRNVMVFAEGTNLNDAAWRRFIGNDRNLVERERYSYAIKGGVQLKF